MDEPLSNLDAKLRVQMRAEINKLQRPSCFRRRKDGRGAFTTTNWQRPAVKTERSRRAASIFAAAATASADRRDALLPPHTYASLRLAEQRLSLQEIAEEMGHTVEVLARTYAHVISEYRGRGPIAPDALIRAPAAEKRPKTPPSPTTNSWNS